jgi:hypothetical protein
VAELRRREALDAVVAGAADEIERFRRLMHWTRAQFPLGDPDPYPLCNGLSILDDIRAGRTGGFCGQYSYLLADALKSFGYFSVRYLELETADGEGHFAVEAWSNQFDRWMVLDPTYDVYYAGDDGTPLSALELHALLLAGRCGGVTVVEGSPPPPAGKRAADLPLNGLERYRHVAVSLRSDLAHLEVPLSLADREKVFLRWEDSPGDPASRFRHLDFKLASGRREDFAFPVGQVTCTVLGVEGDVVTAGFETHATIPHLLGYQVRLDGGEWKRTGARVEWTVPFDSSEHLLEVSAVNVAGVAGPVFGLRATRG